MLVLIVVLVSRLDFPGWILRGLSNLIPSRPASEYTPQEIGELRQKVSSLEQQNTILNEMVLEHQRESSLSHWSVDIPYSLVDARILYRDHARLFDIAIIDRGTNDGVEVEMPVVDSKGLVGRVVATRAAISRVLLLTSPDCSFGVIDQRSRDLGIVRGTEPVKWSMGRNQAQDQVSPNMLQLMYLSPSAQISVQDVLITSGLSGVTPRGIRVGEVVEIISHEEQGRFDIRVRPFADFDHLENVAVVLFREQNIEDLKDLVGVTGEAALPPGPG